MKNKGYLQFRDNFSFDKNTLQALEDSLSLITPQQGNDNFFVRMIASHSGSIINNRMYLPNKMKEGISSFLEPYSKPVLTHHQSGGGLFSNATDPIGRIVEAKYIDTSNSISKIKNSVSDTITDFINGKMTWKDQVDFACTFYNQILKGNEDKFSGLGYAEIVLSIGEPDAIRKFRTKQYLTGSVGLRTNAAICSVCKQDWVEDGFCEHEPGQAYDDIFCFLICGDLIYREYSLVNEPADGWAQVLELLTNSSESPTIKNCAELNIPIYQVPVQLTNYHLTIKEELMKGANKNKKKDISVATDSKIEPDEPEVDPVVIDLNIDPKKTEDNPIKDNPEDVSSTKEDTPTNEPNELDTLLMKVFEKGEISEEESEKLYNYMFEEEEKEKESDAKLTTKQRKKLSSSSFCGPNRSFPVNDCAHYTAALRLIGKYKGPGDKSKIRACIERKGKALGCTGAKKKDSDEVFNPLSVIPNEKYTEDELKIIFNHLKTILNDASSSDLLEDNQALADNIVCLEEQIGSLREQIAILDAKYMTAVQELHVLQERMVEDMVEANSVRKKLVDVLKILNKEPISEIELSSTILNAEISRLTNLIDMSQIEDKLNNGLSRVPSIEERVENPIGEVIDTKNKTEWDKLTEEAKNAIKKKFEDLYKTEGSQAYEYLKWLKDTYNIIPDLKEKD